jgi:uncharacterized protein
MPRRLLRSVLLLAALALGAGVLPAGASGPPAAAGPFDYVQQLPRLSQPDFPGTLHETFTITAHDGVELYMEVTRPDPDAHPEAYTDGGLPVILESSPYHGTIATRIGDRIFPDPIDPETQEKLGLTGYFAPRGYAVAMMDLRGTGRSEGCLDHLGPDDAKDLKTVIEWLADADWSNGKVGMTGHSYVGSTPSVAAAQRPRGLATIIPSAGLASMYDHQFNRGVPWNLQYIGPMVAYEGLALDRHLPPGSFSALGDETGDNFGNGMQYFGCGLLNSAALAGTGQVTGQYELWHARRDHRAGAADADIPVFMVHGVHDNAARIPAAEWFFANRFARPGDKVWIGQWDHGSTNGRCGDPENRRVAHPTCRFDQWTAAVHAWFDKHLMGLPVATGPAVEAFLGGEEVQSLTAVTDPETWGTKVVTADAWTRPTQHLELLPDAGDGSLSSTAPAGTDSASFTPGVQALLAGVGGGSVEFASEPLAEDTVFLGLPTLSLRVSSLAPIGHLTATLHRERPDGGREPLTFCGGATHLRHGIHDLAPALPGWAVDVPLQCFTMAGWAPEGDRLVLEVAPRTMHHASLGADARMSVHTGPGVAGLRLPVVPDARLHDDVPLRAR